MVNAKQFLLKLLDETVDRRFSLYDADVDTVKVRYDAWKDDVLRYNDKYASDWDMLHDFLCYIISAHIDTEQITDHFIESVYVANRYNVYHTSNDDRECVKHEIMKYLLRSEAVFKPLISAWLEPYMNTEPLNKYNANKIVDMVSSGLLLDLWTRIENAFDGVVHDKIVEIAKQLKSDNINYLHILTCEKETVKFLAESDDLNQYRDMLEERFGKIKYGALYSLDNIMKRKNLNDIGWPILLYERFRDKNIKLIKENDLGIKKATQPSL